MQPHSWGNCRKAPGDTLKSLGAFNLKQKEFDMFHNRAFLALLAGLAFLLLQAFFPDLPFTEEQTIAFVAMIAAYMVGEGLEGERIIENLKQLLLSRKFLATIAGLTVLIVQAFYPNFAVTAEHLTELLVLVIGIVLNAGLEAWSARRK